MSAIDGAKRCTLDCLILQRKLDVNCKWESWEEFFFKSWKTLFLLIMVKNTDEGDPENSKIWTSRTLDFRTLNLPNPSRFNPLVQSCSGNEMKQYIIYWKLFFGVRHPTKNYQTEIWIFTPSPWEADSVAKTFSCFSATKFSKIATFRATAKVSKIATF